MVNQQNLTVSNLLHISDLLSCIFVNSRDFPLIRVQPVSRKGTHFNPICQKPSKEKDISYRISAIWNLALSVRGVIRDSVNPSKLLHKHNCSLIVVGSKKCLLVAQKSLFKVENVNDFFTAAAHRSPTNSKFDAWGVTWAKFDFTFQLETIHSLERGD